ncbi:PQ-loop domain-containing transporter [Virgisporangium aurantiacum]|uniref:PQ loop repeat-containing protein n=1 Tax=Virgisporangium aurantiacum TaxID=175570 RepID=A0A8J4E030_9ACTN|nr:PQ-loop domain-containing transporter [Virgisporangium aurantiacum]GIJ56351.1 hypothetical protein Vau01_038670 [Virgisporangium aurantiacum]
MNLVDALPVAAAALAAPQFLPQLVGVWRRGDAAGVSWSWAALTSVGNAAWTVYFALSGMWTALVPSISATVFAGVLAILLGRDGVGRRPVVMVAGWTTVLAAAWMIAGRAGLGTALAASFVLQVTPSVWTAYRTRRPTGISRGTWLLILGELACWGAYGLAESDPRLTVLGGTGVIASLLMLARTRADPRLTPIDTGDSADAHHGGGTRR